MISAAGRPVHPSWLPWMCSVSRGHCLSPVQDVWLFVRFAAGATGVALATKTAPPESSRSTVISRPFAVTRTVFSSGGISACGIAFSRFSEPMAFILTMLVIIGFIVA